MYVCVLVCGQFSEQTVTVYTQLVYMNIVSCQFLQAAEMISFFFFFFFILVVYSEILTLKMRCGMQRFLADTVRAQTNTEMEVF